MWLPIDLYHIFLRKVVNILWSCGEKIWMCTQMVQLVLFAVSISGDLFANFCLLSFIIFCAGTVSCHLYLTEAVSWKVEPI